MKKDIITAPALTQKQIKQLFEALNTPSQMNRLKRIIESDKNYSVFSSTKTDDKLNYEEISFPMFVEILRELGTSVDQSSYGKLSDIEQRDYSKYSYLQSIIFYLLNSPELENQDSLQEVLGEFKDNKKLVLVLKVVAAYTTEQFSLALKYIEEYQNN